MNKHYPLIIFLYKRPAETAQMLEAINSQIGKREIYFFLDHAKDQDELASTHQVRELVTKFAGRTKDSLIKVISRPHNYGLQKNITLGITQVLKSNSAAIILEGDCIPSSDFFRFVDTMLTRYQTDQRVMSVAGSSVNFSSPYSYDFARYQLCWGWGTWARAWDHYDTSLSTYSPDNFAKISATWGPYIRWYFAQMLKLVKIGQVKSWAFHWSYTLFCHRGLAIIPKHNLITNIGFGKNSTNTKFHSPLANQPAQPQPSEIIHPPDVVENQDLNHQIENYYYANPIAFLGLIRQLFYYYYNNYVARH